MSALAELKSLGYLAEETRDRKLNVWGGPIGPSLHHWLTDNRDIILAELKAERVAESEQHLKRMQAEGWRLLQQDLPPETVATKKQHRPRKLSNSPRAVSARLRRRGWRVGVAS